MLRDAWRHRRHWSADSVQLDGGPFRPGICGVVLIGELDRPHIYRDPKRGVQESTVEVGVHVEFPDAPVEVAVVQAAIRKQFERVAGPDLGIVDRARERPWWRRW